MLLNPVERLLMNNPARAFVQRHFEAKRLLRMGGRTPSGRVLEIGCGRGVGMEIALDRFAAERVDGFDLDPRMVALARTRLAPRGEKSQLWIGDASAIPAADGAYAAVFDFGIIHHVPDWRKAVAEIHRVLKPGGRFYAEEILGAFILNPIVRRLVVHPVEDRFDAGQFRRCLVDQGFEVKESVESLGWAAWFVAEKETWRPHRNLPHE